MRYGCIQNSSGVTPIFVIADRSIQEFPDKSVSAVYGSTAACPPTKCRTVVTDGIALESSAAWAQPTGLPCSETILTRKIKDSLVFLKSFFGGSYT